MSSPAGDTTTAADIAATVARVRNTFCSGRTKPLAWRRRQLRSLRALLTEQSSALEEALHADLGKHRAEAQLT
ncbi:MAG: aldehyde dehydrogenase family protein, partial [Mycobacterium sp.]